MNSHYLTAGLTALLILAGTNTASAIIQYQRVFIDEYCDNHDDKDFARFVKRKGKCFLCHQGTKDRKNNNAYGDALAKYLDHETDKKDVEKIRQALLTVADLPSDPDDPNSETFGERITNSKLPAGELEDLKKEPGEEVVPTVAAASAANDTQ